VPEQQLAQNVYDDGHPDRQKGDTVRDAMATPALLMGMLFPVIVVAAAYLLLRGHDLPGGGFVAGVTMAVAFILQYVGLLLAGGTGVGAWLFGRPFLTSHFSYLDLPFIGQVPLASAIIFDLGVFALVVGSTVLMLIAIAHQSVRSHRTPRSREPKLPAVPRLEEVE
jgi:multicomponent K+:H+ antiporter subunit A